MKVLLVSGRTILDQFDSLEDLFLIENQLEIVKAKYESNGLQPPEWLEDKKTEVSTEIKTRILADLNKALRLAEAKRMGLRTAAEQRNDLDSQIKTLKDKLNKA